MAKDKEVKTIYKDAGDRFRTIANKRAKLVIRYARLLKQMLPQPSYDISTEDATTLADALDNEVTPIIEKLRDIAENGRQVQPKKKASEVEDVF